MSDINTTQAENSALEMSIGDFATEMDGSQEILAVVDRYELISELGRGGFGAVFLAKDTISDQLVALKTLPPELNHSPDEMGAVRDNFKLVANLNHPNIAAAKHLHKVEKVQSLAPSIYIDPNEYLLVMEYVEGSTLSNWKRQFPGKKVPFDKALSICEQVASALDYAHSQKTIHRDIKPGNIMLDSEGRVKVLDFGLAAEIRSSMSRVSTETGSKSGTRPYMPPEQLLGKKQDHTTDQYALAVMFYELIGGEVPFQGIFETQDQILIKDVVLKETPEALDELSKKQNLALLKALAKERTERYAECGDLISSLSSGKIRKPTNREKSGSGLPLGKIAALLILVIGGGIFYMFYADSQVDPLSFSEPIEPKSESVSELQVSVKPPKLETIIPKKPSPLQSKGAKYFHEVKSDYKSRLNVYKLEDIQRYAGKDHLKIEVLVEEAERLGQEKRWYEAGEKYEQSEGLLVNVLKLTKEGVRLAQRKKEEKERFARKKKVAIQNFEKNMSEATDLFIEAKSLRYSDYGEAQSLCDGALIKLDVSTEYISAGQIRSFNSLKSSIGSVKESLVIAMGKEGAKERYETALSQSKRIFTKAQELKEKDKKKATDLCGEALGKLKIPQDYLNKEQLASLVSLATSIKVLDKSLVLFGLQEGQDWTIPGLNTRLVYIKPGTFTPSHENQVHEETLIEGFWMGEYEVTQKLYKSIMGTNPSHFKGQNLPVEQVSRDNAMDFCRKLTEREQKAKRLPEGYAYTLPTHAQWEYASRAETTGEYPDDLDSVAWYRSNSGGKTHTVGKKRANAWGLYDMYGNVAEYCSDPYSYNHPFAMVSWKKLPDLIFCGGNYHSDGRYCRLAIPSMVDLDSSIGFRLVCAPVR